MKSKFLFATVVALSFSACVAPHETGIKPAPKHHCGGPVSPDKQVCVRLVEVGKHAAPLNENRVDVFNTLDQKVASKSFKSSDGEHGRNVVKSMWTPNSRFFVFSTASSGGHSPWHAQTYFYDRQKNNFRELDDSTGPIIKETFTVKAPDRVRVTIQGTAADPSDIVTGTPKEVQLSTLP